MIKIIAAVGKNLELGKGGDLIWRLPNDLKFFKEQTTGCPVVMGRNTFNSLPKQLPNREHHVLTDCIKFNKALENGWVYFDFSELLKAVKKIAQEKDVYIIGGASVYSQFLKYADELILTEIDAEDVTADVYFPAFNRKLYTRTVIGENTDGGIKYKHVKYTKK